MQAQGERQAPCRNGETSAGRKVHQAIREDLYEILDFDANIDPNKRVLAHKFTIVVQHIRHSQVHAAAVGPSP